MESLYRTDFPSLLYPYGETKKGRLSAALGTVLARLTLNKNLAYRLTSLCAGQHILPLRKVA